MLKITIDQEGLRRRIDNEMRGTFAVYAVELELIMNEIISYYFCQSEDRRTALLELILYDTRTGLDRKIDILKYIVNSIYHDRKDRNSVLIESLQKVQELRNDLSHSVPSPKNAKWGANEYEMIVLRYKKHKLVEQTITFDRLNDGVISALNALRALEQILDTISKGKGKLPIKGKFTKEKLSARKPSLRLY